MFLGGRVLPLLLRTGEMRPERSLWESFERSRSDPNKVSCKHCKLRMFRHAKRCRNKLSKCAGIVASRSNLESLSSQDEYTQAPATQRQCPDPEQSVVAVFLEEDGPSNVTAESNISKYFNIMSDTRKNDLKELLAKAFFSGHVSFQFAENKFLEKFFQEVGLEKVLPTRKELAGSLLESIYDQILDGIRFAMQDSEAITISVDGSKNAHNMGVLCIMVCTPKPYVYKVFETREHSVTADYIVAKLENVIADIDATKIVALVTDNASEMLSEETL